MTSRRRIAFANAPDYARFWPSSRQLKQEIAFIEIGFNDELRRNNSQPASGWVERSHAHHRLHKRDGFHFVQPILQALGQGSDGQITSSNQKPCQAPPAKIF